MEPGSAQLFPHPGHPPVEHPQETALRPRHRHLAQRILRAGLSSRAAVFPRLNRVPMTLPRCFPHPPEAPTLPLVLLAPCLSLPPTTVARPLGAQGNDFLYQVEPHDTLEQLARRYTLRAEHWPELQRLNQVEDPYRLPIGKVLRIPLSLIPEQPATATIVHVAGQVAADGRPVRPGDILRANQSLRSDAGSTATLQLED